MSEHIISLKVDNVKKLTAVAIKLDENARTVVISGENGAGKSSVLDSIEMVLAGKAVIPEQPIRNGKKTARIILETETMIVTRTFSAESGENYLKFENKEGFRASTPQKLLNDMIEKIGFDPLEFANMGPDDQAKKLLTIFPTTINLAENANFAKCAYDERAIVNRELKSLVAQMSAQKSFADDLPTEEVSVSALGLRSSELWKELDGVTRMGADLAALAVQIKRSEEQEANLKSQLEAKIKALRDDCAAQCDVQIRLREALNRDVETMKNMEVRDPEIIKKEIDSIDQSIQKAEGTNSEVRRRKNVTFLKENIEQREKTVQDLEGKMLKLTDARTNALKEAKFPIEGLSIDNNGHVILNGVPFGQASMAQKLIVGIAIAASSKNKLRVCLIRDASLLDAKSMKLVEEMAIKHDLQIWMERVEDNSPCSVQIVDGSNIGAKDAPEVEDPAKGAAETSKSEAGEFALGGAAPAASGGRKRGKKAADNVDPFKA